MDFGVNYRSFWIAEYDQLPLSALQKYSSARLNNGEIREITAHPAGDQTGKYEFFRLELQEDQITVQELRWNREGEAELTLQNSGNAITVNITELGNVTLPAYSLRTFRWNLKNN